MEKRDWNYFGLFLGQLTKERLRKFLIESEYGELFQNAEREYIDHCTLLHISRMDNDIKSFCERNIGERFVIQLNSIGVSEKTMAFGVKLVGIPCNNSMPHITICTFKGGKPVDSNKITDWHKLDKPFLVSVTLKASK